MAYSSRDMPYCTHACLLHYQQNIHLPNNQCSNQSLHTHQQSGPDPLVQLLSDQLAAATDGSRNGLTSLGPRARSGEYFKVHIFRTGHCLAAKGIEPIDQSWIENEIAVFERLHDLQGQAVPVFCGVLPLASTITAPSGRPISHLMLHSWAGELIGEDARHDEAEIQAMLPILKPRLLSAVEAIHTAQVVHGNAERHSLVLDKVAQRIIVVDFERSRIYTDRPPCDTASSCKKTYRDQKGRRKLCMYCRELWIAGESLVVRSSAPDREEAPLAPQRPPTEEVAGDAGEAEVSRAHHMTLRSRRQ